MFYGLLMEQNPITTPKELFTALRDAAVNDRTIAHAVGRSESTVRDQKNQTLISAAWFEPLKSICEQKRVSCPKELFRWAKPRAAK